MSLLAAGVALLAATVFVVPLFGRLGLGAVLGYLAAGVALGPSAFDLFDDPETVRHNAELGVVLLLFVIGLELQPSRLWALRRQLLGLGFAQVAASTVLLAGVCFAAGIGGVGALIAGFALALSSTAFALQTLAERRELSARHGRASFAILLFQDLAIIPVLAVLPLFAVSAIDAPDGHGGHSIDLVKTVAIVAGLLVGGRFVLARVLRIVARSGMHDVFTALALLVALGSAWLMELAGLSMALGAFVAGVLLADSEYRHDLEANIEPFKGLLLGLFFMTVGMSVNLDLLLEAPARVLGLVAALLAVKALVLVVLGRVQGQSWRSSAALAISISQGGEFAFVLLGMASAGALVAGEDASLLTLVVTLSMAVTPLLFALYDRLPVPRGSQREYDTMPDEDPPVIIAGFGRFGQITGRILRARHIPFTALDSNPDHIDFVAKFGNKVFYGDAARVDLLRAAGAAKARVLVLSIDDKEAAVEATRVVREHFPNLTVIARAADRKQEYRLMDAGATLIRRETLLSALDVAKLTLVALGDTKAVAGRTVETFRRHDEERLKLAYAAHDDEQRMIYLAQASMRELESLFEEDRPVEGATDAASAQKSPSAS